MKIKAAEKTYLKSWKKYRPPKDESLSPSQAARLQSLIAGLQQPVKQPTPAESKVLIEAAAALGVTLNNLNSDQRRLLVTMGSKAMTRAARLRALEDAS